jgi:hypothetical protein
MGVRLPCCPNLLDVVLQYIWENAPQCGQLKASFSNSGGTNDIIVTLVCVSLNSLV